MSAAVISGTSCPAKTQTTSRTHCSPSPLRDVRAPPASQQHRPQLHISTPQLFDTVRDALSSAAHVVHLTPSSDPEVSLAVLRERYVHEREADWVIDGVDWLHTWLNDGLDASLATHHVATGTEPADATAHRVLALLPPTVSAGA